METSTLFLILVCIVGFFSLIVGAVMWLSKRKAKNPTATAASGSTQSGKGWGKPIVAIIVILLVGGFLWSTRSTSGKNDEDGNGSSIAPSAPVVQVVKEDPPIVETIIVPPHQHFVMDQIPEGMWIYKVISADHLPYKRSYNGATPSEVDPRKGRDTAVGVIGSFKLYNESDTPRKFNVLLKPL